MSHVLQEHEDIGGILSECTMIPGYSQAMRNEFNLPVLDAMTAVDILMSSIRGSSILKQAQPRVKPVRDQVNDLVYQEDSYEIETLETHEM